MQTPKTKTDENGEKNTTLMKNYNEGQFRKTRQKIKNPEDRKDNNYITDTDENIAKERTR